LQGAKDANLFLDKYPESKKFEQVLSMGKFLFEKASELSPDKAGLKYFDPKLKRLASGLGGLEKRGAGHAETKPKGIKKPKGFFFTKDMVKKVQILNASGGWVDDLAMATFENLKNIEKNEKCSHEVFVPRKTDEPEPFGVTADIRLCKAMQGLVIDASGSHSVKILSVQQYSYDCTSFGSGFKLSLAPGIKSGTGPSLFILGDDALIKQKLLIRKLDTQKVGKKVFTYYDINGDGVADICEFKAKYPGPSGSEEFGDDISEESATFVNIGSVWNAIASDNNGSCS
jgi:hypothetical protein